MATVSRLLQNYTRSANEEKTHRVCRLDYCKSLRDSARVDTPAGDRPPLEYVEWEVPDAAARYVDVLLSYVLANVRPIRRPPATASVYTAASASTAIHADNTSGVLK